MSFAQRLEEKIKGKTITLKPIGRRVKVEFVKISQEYAGYVINRKGNMISVLQAMELFDEKE